MSVEHYRSLVTRALGGRRVVLVAATPETSAGTVRQLLDLGVAGVFVVAESGDPGPGAFSLGLPRVPSDSDTEHRLQAVLGAPSPALVEALDRFDLDGSALVLDSYFATTPALAGRRRYGWRRPGWAAIEDKTLVEEVWQAAGIRSTASRVVASGDTAAFARAAHALDRGNGVVCAADASAGWNTAGERTFCLPDPSAWEVAHAALAPVAERIRVMPYVTGTPVSVHVIVFDDDVAVFPPVELVTLHPPDGGAFRFAGASTAYRAPDDLAAEVRAMAVALATYLRAALGYRGPFTLDGVAGEEGFVPTEINARFGSGLGVEHSLPELPLYLLSRCVQEGEPFRYDARALESLVVEATRFHPTYHVSLKCDAGAPPVRLPVTDGDDGFAVDPAGTDADLTVEPDPGGGWSEWSVSPRGDARCGVLGPKVRRLLRETTDPLGLGLPELVTSAAPVLSPRR